MRSTEGTMRGGLRNPTHNVLMFLATDSVGSDPSFHFKATPRISIARKQTALHHRFR